MSSKIDPSQHQEVVGRSETGELGRITQLMARRYARAVEDDNPLFHDVEYARKWGYEDVVLPPNYLPAIIDPSAGAPADQLREDGLNPDRFPIPLPAEAMLMGGGQNLTIERYVTAGERVSVEETVLDLHQRQSDSMGTLTFLETRAEYYGDEADQVLSCEKTMIIGDRT